MNTDISRGFAANLPIAASVGAYGSVLGVLAAQKGIVWSDLLLMNLFVFAGSAQFVMVEMWTAPLPCIEIMVAVLAVNARYMLIGASLKPVFSGRSLRHKMLVMHLVADENWAVTMAEHRKRKTSTFFLLGGGLCVITFWCLGTLSGHLLQAFIQNPEAYAMDFAFVAVFTALTVSLWRGKTDLLPWISAALTAIAAEKLFPGKWYIVFGGISGASISAFMKTGEPDVGKKGDDR